MVNSISFPGLFDHVFEINRVAFTVFGHPIMWYGIILAFGFLLAALYAFRHCSEFNWNSDRLLDGMLWALPAAIIGCRAYYVLNEWDYYGQHLDEIIKINKGGLGIYGGIIAVVIVSLIFCRHYKLDFLSIMDLVSIGFLIGQCIGRWANFINAEAHGGFTDLPWGMVINGQPPVHPTFLYESLWTLTGFLFLNFYYKRRKFRGEISLMYIGWYGMIRFLTEFLRTDSLFIGHTGIKASQLLGGICVLVSVGMLIYFYTTKKYPKPFAPAPAEAAPEASEKNSSGEDSKE